MRILAIDPGTSCGWAIWDGGDVVHAGTWDLSSRRFEGGGMRYVHFERFFREALPFAADDAPQKLEEAELGHEEPAPEAVAGSEEPSTEPDPDPATPAVIPAEEPAPAEPAVAAEPAEKLAN